MKYISIGAVSSGSNEYILKVAHGGYNFQLDGVLAKLWLNGRSQFCTVEDPIEIKGLTQLLKMGLAVQAEECSAGEYRALTHCTIVPAECKFPFLFLSHTSKQALTWLRRAGLVLSMAELIYLVEKDGKQFLVTITDEFIETRKLAKRITAEKFEIGDWKFIKCAYEVKE